MRFGIIAPVPGWISFQRHAPPWNDSKDQRGQTKVNFKALPGASPCQQGRLLHVLANSRLTVRDSLSHMHPGQFFGWLWYPNDPDAQVSPSNGEERTSSCYEACKPPRQDN